MIVCRKLLALLLVFTQIAVLPQPVQAGSNGRILILKTEAVRLTEADRKRLYDILVSRISSYRIFDVTAEETLKSTLAQKKQQQALGNNCLDDAKCSKQLAVMLDSDWLLRSRAIGVGKLALVNLELVQNKTGSIRSKAEVELPRPISGSTEIFENAVDSLLRPLKLTGIVQVVPEAIGSELILPNKHKFRFGAKQKQRSFRLPVGSHRLTLLHPDYLPLSERVLVPAGKMLWAPDQISKAELRPPWYASWWFWTLTAVVIGSSVGSYLYATREPKEPAKTPAPFGKVILQF